MFEDYLVSTAKYSPAHFRRRVVSTDLSADLLSARPKDKRVAEPEIVQPSHIHYTPLPQVRLRQWKMFYATPYQFAASTHNGSGESPISYIYSSPLRGIGKSRGIKPYAPV